VRKKKTLEEFSKESKAIADEICKKLDSLILEYKGKCDFAIIAAILAYEHGHAIGILEGSGIRHNLESCRYIGNLYDTARRHARDFADSNVKG